METVSERSSLHSGCIPVLDQPDDTADHTLEDILMQSMQKTAHAEDATPVLIIDPESLPGDTEVHLLPVSVDDNKITICGQSVLPQNQDCGTVFIKS